MGGMVTGFLLLGAVLAAAYWRVVARGHAPTGAEAVIKAASVGVLALCGLAAGGQGAVVAGLALGAAGDFALARPGGRWFLAGMAAFAAGHLAYAAGFAAMGATWPPVWLAVGMGVLAASTEVWLAPRTGALRGPVRGYVAVIVAMALVAGGLPQGFGMVQAGVAMFVLSDLLLALDRFVLREAGLRRLCALALWPLYWGGQAMILWGALSTIAPLA